MGAQPEHWVRQRNPLSLHRAARGILEGLEAKLPGATNGNRAAHLLGDFENPAGEWNTIELYTLGRTSVHVVNGHVDNVIQNASTIEGPEHTETPLSSGQLQIQSEGAETYYRRVEIEPITELPAEIK